jgi:hypothetical protein
LLNLAFAFPVTSFFIGLNLYTYWKKERYGIDYSDELFLYDSWENFKFLFDKKPQLAGKENKFMGSTLNVTYSQIEQTARRMKKVFFTLFYPKNEKELINNLGMYYLFSRPLEMLVGSRPIILTLVLCYASSYLILNSKLNRINTDERINAHSLIVSTSLSLTFFFSSLTNVFSVIRWLSFFNLINVFFMNMEYESRTDYLSALLVCLYMKYRIKLF